MTACMTERFLGRGLRQGRSELHDDRARLDSENVGTPSRESRRGLDCSRKQEQRPRLDSSSICLTPAPNCCSLCCWAASEGVSRASSRRLIRCRGRRQTGRRGCSRTCRSACMQPWRTASLSWSLLWPAWREAFFLYQKKQQREKRYAPSRDQRRPFIPEHAAAAQKFAVSAFHETARQV